MSVLTADRSDDARLHLGDGAVPGLGGQGRLRDRAGRAPSATQTAHLANPVANAKRSGGKWWNVRTKVERPSPMF